MGSLIQHRTYHVLCRLLWYAVECRPEATSRAAHHELASDCIFVHDVDFPLAQIHISISLTNCPSIIGVHSEDVLVGGQGTIHVLVSSVCAVPSWERMAPPRVHDRAYHRSDVRPHTWPLCTSTRQSQLRSHTCGHHSSRCDQRCPALAYLGHRRRPVSAAAVNVHVLCRSGRQALTVVQ
jgi:hypothetical protein